ncbi:hypothetical protein MIMGU_mgv1a007984mg [Erythranthe guttata]|uniref:Uncharacterized protein n=1 Tax=Erythranthe guttata TaxID=4155 RepID=A0A022R144_ERYGU|nr:PREDICTED: UPF0481 protein At3g47200-like [Erythranthe guttata]EYU32505.1 hypothetical protein MIMGU_mgv1a007984mg [Erythranthe guttata]|eukprot:XP_012843309.1 PREDICTED: UPF0481 protein At3g47200-like [Erythranthe guttata]
MSRKRDNLAVVLDGILVGLPPLPSSAPTIFRVDDDLRSPSSEHYEPKLISIGPFHYGKAHLQKMEIHKLRYLKNLLKETRESSVDRYIAAMRPLEKRARACYLEGDLGDFTSDQFVLMMLVDGCFVIEFLRKLFWVNLREKDDPVFRYRGLLGKVQLDLILLENQVPFFVLDKLFSMTIDESDDVTILFLIRFYAGCVSPWPIDFWDQDVAMEDVDHLLGLLHRLWCSSVTKLDDKKGEVEAVKSVSELKEFGIEFEKIKKTDCGLNIQFIDGVLKLPGVIFADVTERVFRNLIAYEHYFIEGRPRFVSNYIYFVRSLVSSSNDVKLLRDVCIVTSPFRNDEKISLMLESLSTNVYVTSYYSDICSKVIEHCDCEMDGDFEEGGQSNTS